MSPACSRRAHTDGRSRRSDTRGSRSRPYARGRALRNPTAPMRITPAPSRRGRRRRARPASSEAAARLRRTSSRIARRGPCGMSSRAGTRVDVVGAEQQARLRQLRAHPRPVRLDVLDVVEHETRQCDVAHVVVARGGLLGRRLDRQRRTGAHDTGRGLPRSQRLELVEQCVAVDGRAERDRLHGQSGRCQRFEVRGHQAIETRRGHGVEPGLAQRGGDVGERSRARTARRPSTPRRARRSATPRPPP